MILQCKNANIYFFPEPERDLGSGFSEMFAQAQCWKATIRILHCHCFHDPFPGIHASKLPSTLCLNLSLIISSFFLFITLVQCKKKRCSFVSTKGVILFLSILLLSAFLCATLSNIPSVFSATAKQQMINTNL